MELGDLNNIAGSNSEPSEDIHPWSVKKRRKIHKSATTKKLITSGKAYVSRKGKHISERAIGRDCKCKKFQCFEIISSEIRQTLFQDFYNMSHKNEQDSHLVGLMSMKTIGRRRPRDNVHENKRKTKPAMFDYKVRYNGREYQICRIAFLSVHGITEARLRRLQNSVVTTGKSPKDMRGKHLERPRNYSQEVIFLIKQHICSFKPRQSHYSRRKNPEHAYLPEELTVKDMHSMFVLHYRLNISYKIYWSVFKNEFNIKFGFPRSDTCAACDNFTQRLNDQTITQEDKRSLLIEKEMHLRKAEAFFALKRKYKEKAERGEVECLSFDYMQNLPLPHMPSNPVFYARQLWYHVFGIHNLGNDQATMYTYHEGEAKKGSNEVTSMLLHYINTHDRTNRSLVLMSDGCPGQNKNYVMLHFLYFVVHVLKLFDTVRYIFPMRGHSYLPNDQDFTLIEKKKRKIGRVELPDEWCRLICEARTKPSPFELAEIGQQYFFDIKQLTDKYFLKSPKPAVMIKNVRQIEINKGVYTVNLRDTYTGPWRSSVVRSKIPLSSEIRLICSYSAPLTISPLKVANLRSLLHFLEKPDNRSFYENLFSSMTNPTASTSINNTDNSSLDVVAELDEDDNSSGCDD